MKNLIRLIDYNVDEIKEIYKIADEIPKGTYENILKCKVTTQVMEKANRGAILNPCPPFYREEEVSEDVINSDYFVGYEFKKYLLQVQQAIMIYCLTR